MPIVIRSHIVRRLLNVLSVAAIILAGGCDSTELDPFQNPGRFYSIFGYLDDLENRHVMRIVEVRRTPERILTPIDPHAELDAVVTTTDTRTGQVVRWNHRLEQLSDGTFGHIFRSNFNLRAGRTYRLDVVRNDGTTASALTTVPDLSIERAMPGEPVVLADSSVHLDVFLPDVHSPWNIDVVYYHPFSTPSRFTYGRVGEAVEGVGWTFRIDVTGDIRRMLEEGNLNENGIEFDAMGVKVVVLDDKWDPPGDVFDPEILALPGTLSNVENGYGFFGSIGLFQSDWQNSQVFDDLLGF